MGTQYVHCFLQHVSAHYAIIRYLIFLTFTCIHLLVFLDWPMFIYWKTGFLVVCNEVLYKKVCSSLRLNINC
jgi:hypothetical protein